MDPILDRLDVERRYWHLQGQLNLFEYLIPVNLYREKNKFISNFKKQIQYDPIFNYKEFDFDPKDVINKLTKFKKHFEKTPHPLSAYYLELIEDDIEQILNLSKRQTPKLTEWLSDIYGKPQDHFYKQALRTIQSLKTAKEHQEVKPNTMKHLIISKLRERGIKGWIVKITISSARISVNNTLKTIFISSGSLFSFSELDRLIVHEIGTHVLRYENGNKQKYMIFSQGFPDFLKTEEGLAIWSEYKNNLLSNNDMVKYCARLIACYVCFNFSFSEVFKMIVPFLNYEDSFDIVARVKRGLIDTSRPGGFTKDQIYYSGFNDIKNLPQQDIKKLFIGKIGIEHLDLIPQLDGINPNIEIPEWV